MLGLLRPPLCLLVAGPILTVSDNADSCHFLAVVDPEDDAPVAITDRDLPPPNQVTPQWLSCP